MHCEACCAHPQLGAQPKWISGMKSVKWSKVHIHQQCGTHAIFVALWELGSKVRNVTHTLPLPMRQAIRALFHLVYRAVSRCFAM